jgi:hypothetical protein
MVLRECLVKFTTGLTFDYDSRFIVEVRINTSGGPIVIPITEYHSAKDFIKRADKIEIIDPLTTTGDLQKAVITSRLYFSQQVILWDSGGETTEDPKVNIGGVYVAADLLGLPKFNSLVARINGNSPYLLGDSSTPEMVMCRYFLTTHNDPASE